MIKAIIFDCYGVLTTDGWRAFKHRYFKDGQEGFEKLTELNHKTNSGQLDYQEFLKQAGERTGISAERAREQIETNQPNDELFSYIRSELKPKYRIGMLSNAAGNRLEQLFTKDQAALFDQVILSYETGAIKPEEEAYIEAARQLGVEPGECVFVDDKERHCDGARRVGMRTVQYQDFNQFKEELERITK